MNSHENKGGITNLQYGSRGNGGGGLFEVI